jgi:hypothetical protein
MTFPGLLSIFKSYSLDEAPLWGVGRYVVSKRKGPDRCKIPFRTLNRMLPLDDDFKSEPWLLCIMQTPPGAQGHSGARYVAVTTSPKPS